MQLLFLILFFFIGANNLLAQTSFGVWSEWTSYKNLESKIAMLEEKKIRLHLGVKKDELINPQVWMDLVSLLKIMKYKKIEVWLWPLLERENGYWPNQWNMNLYDEYVKELILNLAKENLRPQGVSIDLEPSPEKLKTFINHLTKLEFKKLKEFSRSNIDEKLFEASTEKLDGLVQFLKNQHIQTHAVTTPFLLDDKSPDHRLQKVFGIPFKAELFDYVSFMAYRSEFERLVGNMNSRLVYYYAQKAKDAFGHKAAIDLGVVGNIDFPHKLEGHSRPERLWEDISAAKAGGITRLQIYCLDGIDNKNWVKDNEPLKPWPSIKFFLIRLLISFLINDL